MLFLSSPKPQYHVNRPGFVRMRFARFKFRRLPPFPGEKRKTLMDINSIL